MVTTWGLQAVDSGRSSMVAVSDTLELGSSRGAQFVSEPRTVVLSVAEIQLAQAHGLVAAVWLGRMVRQRSLAAHFEASCPVRAFYFRYLHGGEVCVRGVLCRIPVARLGCLVAGKVGSCCARDRRIQGILGSRWCIYFRIQ